MGNWIQTYTGAKFYPMEPDPNLIWIEDIAHSLAMQCRFNGHVKQFYSVAEHCVHVSNHLPRHLQLAGLLHDASEAYLCDLPKPLKDSSQLAQYREIEAVLDLAIQTRFNVCLTEKAIKAVDEKLLYTEAGQLLRPLHPDWPMGEPLHFRLPCWSPCKAEQQFLLRFACLQNG